LIEGYSLLISHWIFYIKMIFISDLNFYSMIIIIDIENQQLEAPMTNKLHPQAALICSKLTLTEKILLCNGKNFWQTMDIKRLNIPSLTMTDGPHGVRQLSDYDKLDTLKAIPSTCFPPAVTTACSFDPSILELMGYAIGSEAKANGINILLGPGMNIKRDPRCGRNFEYFSEDPLLTAKLATGMVLGIQKSGVSATIKHYLGNNQEAYRMTSNSIIDQRALNEIYLKAFIKTIKESNPDAIMTAYNKVNGKYVGEHDFLLQQTLRRKLNYQGLVMTDWGAINDPVASISQGLDLVMPVCTDYFYKTVKVAVQNGQLSEDTLDQSVIRILSAVLNINTDTVNCNPQEHHQLVRKIARESAVLLENDGILPISKDQSITLVGTMAKKPRFQGSGSSKVTPTQVTTLYDVLSPLKMQYHDGNLEDPSQLKEMVLNSYLTILTVGLPESYESEGFDRTHLNLPDSDYKLIEYLQSLTNHLIVIIMSGGAVNLNFTPPNALLQMHLTGQNNGDAIYDLLFGDYSPCGKLAETYPINLKDVPSYGSFATQEVQYQESVYVGYRYYVSKQQLVRYPFGYGLTYSSFKYEQLTISKEILKPNETIDITFILTNTGKYQAAEIVQLYTAPPALDLNLPSLELRNFTKIMLSPMKQKSVTLSIDYQDLSYYNSTNDAWEVLQGKYSFIIGASSEDLKLEAFVMVLGEEPPQHLFDNDHELNKTNNSINQQVTESLPKYHLNSLLGDLQHTLIGKIIYKMATMTATNTFNEDNQEATKQMISQMPIRAILLFANGMIKLKWINTWLNYLNKHQ
jgi:beta-glucosidase